METLSQTPQFSESGFVTITTTPRPTDITEAPEATTTGDSPDESSNTAFPIPTVLTDIPEQGPRLSLPYSQWSFPRALNRTFAHEFYYNLPSYHEAFVLKDSPASGTPLQVYAKYGEGIDILLESLYNLEYQQRADPVIGYNGFGHEENPVRVGDRITLDWEGDDERVVMMTCHNCPNYWGEGRRIIGECKRFIREYSYDDHVFAGALSTDESRMEKQFKLPYPGENVLSNPRISSGTTIEIPHLPGKTRAYVCMLSIHAASLGSYADHAAPFPVYGEPRPAGPWGFSRDEPTGKALVSDDFTNDNSPSDGGNSSDKGPGISTTVGAGLGAVAGLIIVLALSYRLFKGSCGRRIEKDMAQTLPVSSRSTTHATSRQSVASTPRRPEVSKTEDTLPDVPPPTYQEATAGRQSQGNSEEIRPVISPSLR